MLKLRLAYTSPFFHVYICSFWGRGYLSLTTGESLVPFFILWESLYKIVIVSFSDLLFLF